MLSNFWKLFAVGLICGSINSISLKICYQTGFEKPWFMSFVMFVSMALAIPAYVGQVFYQKILQPKRKKGNRDSSQLVQSLLAIDGCSATDLPNNTDAADSRDAPDSRDVSVQEDDSTRTSQLWVCLVIFFPSICDLLGTSLQQMGLCVTSVSVFQMLKGSILLFSAMLSVFCLGKKLDAYNWAETDGTADFPADQHSVMQVLTGIFLIILGQVVCASQYVVEEYLLSPPNTASPLMIVGLEGFWGSIVMLGMVLPMCQFLIPGDDVGGVYENSYDSVQTVATDSTVQVCIAVFFVSVLLYNIIGVTVTAESSAVHHTFLDASRTAVIWLISVCIYYFINPIYGEPLNMYSPLQFIGFVILIMGQLIYDQVIYVPENIIHTIDQWFCSKNSEDRDSPGDYSETESPTILHDGAPLQQGSIFDSIGGRVSFGGSARNLLEQARSWPSSPLDKRALLGSPGALQGPYNGALLNSPCALQSPSMQFSPRASRHDVMNPHDVVRCGVPSSSGSSQCIDSSQYIESNASNSNILGDILKGTSNLFLYESVPQSGRNVEHSSGAKSPSTKSNLSQPLLDSSKKLLGA